MTQEWNIRPRAATCSACGKTFEDGEWCFSGIETVEGEWMRRDFCAACRPDAQRTHPAVSVWRGRFRAPQSRQASEPVQPETAESLLRRLLDEDAGANVAVVFVLAVMLERRKVLVERDVRDQPDGERKRLYEHRRSGEIFLITDPRLRLDALLPVQEAVMQRLKGAP